VIFVDTSAWIDHLRSGEPSLAAALEGGRVLMHPFVLGELACGNPENRGEVLRLLGYLPSAPTATDPEVLGLIERRALMGRGIGYIDVHLLASTALAGVGRLWARDRRLAAVDADLQLDLFADIAILLTYLSYELSIDLESAVSSKIMANGLKYPLEKSRGSNKKYTDL
jgi:predicted nucleic acid-binding protein